jgi:hypothetical protein
LVEITLLTQAARTLQKGAVRKLIPFLYTLRLREPRNPKITIYGYNTYYDKHRDNNYMLITFTDNQVHVTDGHRFTLTVYDAVQLYTRAICMCTYVTFPCRLILLYHKKYQMKIPNTFFSGDILIRVTYSHFL